MNKTEKQFKEYMNSKIHVKDTFAKISKRIDFNEKEEKNFMAKNKFLPVLCCFAAVGVVAVGVVTKGFGLFEKEAKSMVTIYVNPSVELVLSEDDKVLSVRGANDDGKLVIYGERIVGQDVEKAVEIIIQSEIDTGYIVANAQIGANQYSVTINSDTQLISDELFAAMISTNLISPDFPETPAFVLNVTWKTFSSCLTNSNFVKVIFPVSAL